MTTKAIATATVEEIVEKPKRITKSTPKSTKRVVKKVGPKKTTVGEAVVETVSSVVDSSQASSSNPKKPVPKPAAAPRKQRSAIRSGTSGTRTRAKDTCLSEIPIKEIWSMYREEQTQDVRNFLIENTMILSALPRSAWRCDFPRKSIPMTSCQRAPLV